MRSLRAGLSRLAGIFSGDRREREFAAELDAHVQMQIEDNLRAGMSAEEARRAALIQLGGLEQTKQAYRERATTPWVEGMLHDARYVLRQSGRNAGFTVTVALVLALGIGATAAIFSVVNPILFRTLPYADANRIMMIWESRQAGSPMYAAFGTFYGMRERTRSFESMAAFRSWQPAMIGSGLPVRLEGQRVTPDFFRVLGVAPILGRDFQAADDTYRGPNVVMLSNVAWRERFTADPAIVGRKITLDGLPFTVIGVMPASFDNVLAPTAELWSPLQYNPALPTDGREWGHHLQMIGRLRPGVSKQQAEGESSAILQELGRIYSEGYASSGGVPQSMLVVRLQDDVTRDFKPALLAILGGVGLVLLIACVNVTNLLLARGAQRRSEFATRVALGAGRARVIRQLLTESLLLALVGGALGVAVANAGVRVLVALSPADLPRLNAIHLDNAVLAFAFVVTAVVGVIVGLVPALQAAGHDPQSGLQTSSRTTTGKQQLTRRAMVVSEVAVALVLLVSAGLLLRSMQRLFAIPPGFDAAKLMSMQVQDYGRRAGGEVNPASTASEDAARRASENAARARFYDGALQAVQQVPGVKDAAFTSQLPLSGDSETYGVEFQAYPGQMTAAFRYAVSPGYFKTMGISLLSGRLLNENDRPGAPVAVLLSESFAKRMFPRGDAIGQQLRAGPDAGRADSPWAVVVGVVDDVKQESLALRNDEAFYTTSTQWAWVDGVQSLVVRSNVDPTLMTPAIRNAVWSVDKDQPIVRVATMDSLVAASEAKRHFALVLFEAFALVGLLLAATGIYGVLSASVTERTREIGVRAALGASPRKILALVLGQGMQLAGLGVVLGMAGALAASRALMTLLFGISALDPVTYLGVTATLLAVAMVACWIPARRAAQVDPAITLRAD